MVSRLGACCDPASPNMTIQQKSFTFNYFDMPLLTYRIFSIGFGEGGALLGNTRRFDHPSPRCDKLIKHQSRRPLALSTRIGPKWSGGPFFPNTSYRSIFHLIIKKLYNLENGEFDRLMKFVDLQYLEETKLIFNKSMDTINNVLDVFI